MASTHQRKDIGDDSRVVHWSEVVTGTIVSVYSNNTADVTISGVGAVSAVPIFYHCPDDPSVSNGYNAFSQNDDVVILAEKDKLSDTPDYTIIGFNSAELKDCALNIVIRFVPTSGTHADDKCFVWNVSTNTYLPLDGFTAHDNLYNWDEVGTFLNSKKVNDVEPCYSTLEIYGINESDFAGDNDPTIPNYVATDDLLYLCGQEPNQVPIFHRTRNGDKVTDFNYIKPDGSNEIATETIVTHEDYTCLQNMPFSGPGEISIMNGEQSMSRELWFPSYKSGSKYTSSVYGQIQTTISKNDYAFFPLSIRKGGNGLNNCVLDFYSGCTGYSYDSTHYSTGDITSYSDILNAKMTSPIGQTDLFQTKERVLNQHNTGSTGGGDWYYTSIFENTSYLYDIKHHNNGFYKKIMYQVSVGITMMTTYAVSQVWDDPYQPPISTENSTTHNMHVACIASCNTFSGMATYHNPTTQNRNTNLESSIILLVQNSTKQYAIDNSQLPGNVEVFAAHV